MSCAGFFKRALRPGAGQGGFSIAEVMVAGALLTMVSLPIMQMFGTTFRVAGLTDDLNQAQSCVRHFTEETRAVPFYVPYVLSEGDRDMDDLYWGGGRGLTNNWDTAPEIEVKAYDANPYPQFRVTCKMVYLNDDTSEATMRSTWAHKTPNRDDPVDYLNRTINMIKFQIKAYWRVDGAETAGSNHALVSILTRTQVQANLGVNECLVEAARQGTTASSAPHIYNGVNVTITGFGFKPGCTASLLMAANSDINVKGLHFVDSTKLTGYVDLASDGTGGRPWSPRAEPGSWTVKVTVGSAYAALNDGLIAEFPRPALTALNPSSTYNTASDELVTVTGSPILSLAPAGGHNNCRAVSELIWRNPDGSADANKNISAKPGTTAVSGDNYGAGPDQVAARFDITAGSGYGPVPQAYFVRVWNCKDYNNLGQPGDVYAVTSAIPAALLVVELPPEVTQAYRTDMPARSWGFSNRTYNLTIKGRYFDPAGVTVYLGRGGTPPGAPSVQGTAATVVDNQTIMANFDLSGLAGSEGWCWVYVRNDATGSSGYGSNLFQVRKAPSTTGISNTDGKGYKYNYYDIAVSLTGQDYYSGYQVYFQRSSGGKIFQVGDGDGEGAASWSSSTAMTGYLNLINEPSNTLPVGTYNVWVADPADRDNTAAKASFTSSYGPPVLLAPASPYNPTSVWIQFRYRRKVAWVWWGWTGTDTTQESGAANLAWAPNCFTSGWLDSDARETRADFQVQGMGFLDASTGSTTNLNISNAGRNGNFAAVLDRAAKTVYLRTTYWNNVNTSNSWLLAEEGPRSYNLVLTNNNASGSRTYSNRWKTLDTNP